MRPQRSSILLLYAAAAAICACGLIAHPASAQSSRVRFAALEPFPLAVGPEAGVQSFAFADVNRDGRPDLIATDQNAERVSVSLGRGDGTFGEPRSYENDAVPTAVAVADVSSPFASETVGDVDGNPDLIVADDFGVATIFLGRGDGEFDPPEQDLSDILLSSELVGLAVRDFDGNGRLDLALLDAFDEVYPLCNVGGTFDPCGTDVVETGGDTPVAIEAGDFDGDGAPDLAVTNADSQNVSVIFGNGDGSFEAVAVNVPVATGSDQFPSDCAVTRLDADGRDDIVAATSVPADALGLVGLYGTSTRTFVERAFAIPRSVAAIAVGDLDGDGAADVVAASRQPTGVAIVRGDGAGGFLDPEPIPGAEAIGAAISVVTADLDGDERPDFAILLDGGDRLQVALNRPPPACPGDCNENGAVSVDDLILGVNIALGNRPASACAPLDQNQSNGVEINELITAVRYALDGCPA